MIKKWLVTCQCDLDANKILSTVVKANTERKAKIFAEEKWKKEGHFNIWIRKCEEVSFWEVIK